MAAIDSKTLSNVTDFALAREAQIRRARPMQSRLLRSLVVGMDPYTRARFTRAKAEAVINGTPTEGLVHNMLRHQVGQAAKAAI